MYALVTIVNDRWSMDFLFSSVTEEVIDEMRSRLRYGATGYVTSKEAAELIDGKLAVDQFDDDGNLIQEGVTLHEKYCSIHLLHLAR